MDKWILSKLQTLVKYVDNCLFTYKITEPARALQSFVDDMSNWYVRRSRERFWASGMPQDKVNAYMTLYTVLSTLAKVSAPFTPYIAEEIYRNIVVKVDNSVPESVHLCDFPEAVEEWIDKELEENMDLVLDIVVLGRAARNEANIKNRQPIGTMFVRAERALPEMYAGIVLDELNVKKIEFTDDVEGFVTYKFKPQLRTLGPKYGKLVPKIGAALGEANGTALMNELKANGKVKLVIDGTEVELEESDLLIDTAQKEGHVSVENNGVTVVLDTNLSEDLIEEGFVREIVSKIQTMRKEAGFEVLDRIVVYHKDSEKVSGVIERNKESIMGDVLALEMTEGEGEGYTKEWNINGEKVTLTVKKN